MERLSMNMNKKPNLFQPADDDEQEQKKPHEEKHGKKPHELKEITEATVAELEKQLNISEEKLQNAKDDLLRSHAELNNMRNRYEKQIQDSYKYNLEKFIKELVPVMDSIETGLSIPVQHESAKNVHKGMELTLDVLLKALKKFGVKEINPLNEPFNPEFHQALTSKAVQGVKNNTVVEVLQKGYSLNDRLLRPALVVVAKEDGAKPSQDQKENA